MEWNELVSEEALNAADEFISDIRSGRLHPRKVPNASADFDEKVILERMSKKPERDLFEEAMKWAYK